VQITGENDIRAYSDELQKEAQKHTALEMAPMNFIRKALVSR